MNEEEPLREFLSLDEYIAICRDLLLDCFDIEGSISKLAKSNIEAVLDTLDEMDKAEWVDTTDMKE